MKTLYFKEISMFFSSVMGYLVIAVFLLLTGLFLFVFPSNYNILNFGYATLDAFFSMSPLVFLFLIPAITMRSFSEERRTGSLEILMTKPLSELQILLAKFGACLTLLVLALIPTGIYVFAVQKLSQIGSLDMGGIWGSYLGLLFIGAAFTAVGIFLSSVSKNQIVAFILGVIVCGFLLSGFDLIGSFFGSYETFVQDLGMSVHFNSMSRGVIDLRDVMYFLGVIALFISLTLNRLQAQKKSFAKRAQVFGQILLAVVALNVSVSYVFVRLDLTSEKRYTLHRNTKNLIRNLDHVVYFKIYLDGDLPPGFKRLRNSAKEMLDEFQAFNSNVQYEFVNLYDIKDEKTRARASYELMKKGVNATNVEVRESGGTTRKTVFPVAEVTFQGKTEMMELLQSQVGLSPEEALNNSIQTLEYQLLSTIYKLTQEKKKTVAFIQGHGEASVRETVEAAFALSGFYDVDVVPMNQNPASLLMFSEETGEVRPRFDAIVIVNPKWRIPDIDRWTVDQYIMHGGKVLWAQDASDASLDSLRGKDEHLAINYPQNFGDMFFRYGVRINQNLIADLNASPVPLVVGYINEQPQTDFFPYPFLPILVSKNQHPIVKNLNPIRSEFVSSIDTLENDIQKVTLLSTSPYSGTFGLPTIINFNMAKEQKNPEEFRKGELPVAVLLEGSFESHFKNRMAYGLEKIAMPMKTQSEPTKMIVISDADIITNRYQYEQDYPFAMGFDPYTRQTFANKTFFVNCMNYLLDGTLLLDLRAKTMKLRLLDKQRIDREKPKWLALTLGLPTLLIALSGAAFTIYRRRKYAQ